MVTEYRGLTVAELAELRRELAAAGGDYKIFKNTLVRLAVAGGPHEPITDLLTGPTAIAFVHGDVERGGQGPPGLRPGQPAPGDQGRDPRRGGLLTPTELSALADLPSRDVLLAQFAGALAAPLTSWPACSRPCPATWPTGCRPWSTSASAAEPAPAEASAPAPEAPETEAATAEAATAEAADRRGRQPPRPPTSSRGPRIRGRQNPR